MADVKMTAAMVKETAKRKVLEVLSDVLESAGAERYGSDFELAIPTTVDGKEIWVGVVLTAKQYTKTKVSDEFDPFALREEYDAEQAVKKAVENAKAKAKAEKLAKVTKAKPKETA